MAVTYDPRLARLISLALARLQADMARAAPVMAAQVDGWQKALAGSAQPEDYFKHPLAFPSLLLPWWLEETLRPTAIDISFQGELVYSTLNGYYFIRLIDNLMDGQATLELKLLPALAFFHTQYQAAYQRYFAWDHPFWPAFSAVWFQAAEAALQDAQLTGIDRAQFLAVTAKKVSPARIPLLAVCYRYERPDLSGPWSRLVDLFGAWHQMLNDLFDWHRDLQRGGQTYFLSEAARRGCRSNSATVAWVVEQGFQWGIDTLHTWMVELMELAAGLDCPPVRAYLAERDLMLLNRQQEMAAGLHSLTRILKTGAAGHIVD
jgi:hypothetical protein